MTLAPRLAFPRERLDRITGLERSHFWHAPRHRLLLSVVSSEAPPAARVLDVGCGAGALVRDLCARGLDARGVDPWADAAGPENARIRPGEAGALPFDDHSFDAACAFDVLEHTDDGAALAELRRVLAPGGRLFLSVPAHPRLWSVRDERAGHRRRYRRRELVELVERAGFEILRSFGYQFFLLPVLAAIRLGSRAAGARDTRAEDEPAPVVNRLFRAVNELEVGLGPWWRPPTGSSLVVVARRAA